MSMGRYFGVDVIDLKVLIGLFDVFNLSFKQLPVRHYSECPRG